MSRTFNHKRNWFGNAKKSLKEGCAIFSRADARMKLHRIKRDPEIAEDTVFFRFQDYDDWWNYD